MRFLEFMENVNRDVRYSARALRKSPGFTIVAVLTLALGIGVNTAIFSVLNGWLLRPLPVRAPEQIFVLAFSQQHEGSNFSYPDLVDFRNQSDVFSDLFAYGLSVAGLSVRGRAAEFAYSSVTGNYFSALGVKPALGRFFLPGEGETPGAPLLVVLGNSYWRKNFGGDTGVVGAQVLVNGQPATVIGVAPKEFHGTFFAFDMDGFLTLNAMAADKLSSTFWTDRHDRRLVVLGRLKPRASRSKASASEDLIAARLAAEYPSSNANVAIRVIPEQFARPAPLVSSFVPVVASLFLALAALVLLLACVNVANLLLARATAGRRDMAIRSALGASRVRLARQTITETLLLSSLGGGAGALLGEWALSLSGSALRSVTTTSNFAYRLDCSFDWRVFSYTLIAAILTGVFVGLWPALRTGGANMDQMLRAGGRTYSPSAGRQTFRGLLVVPQTAGSLILLIVAGLFVRSLQHAQRMNLGFEPDNVVNVMLDPHQIGYDDIRAKPFYQELERRVRSISGVQTTSLASAVPLGLPGRVASVYVETRPLAPNEQPPQIVFNTVDSDYFATMRIPILWGRQFAESDNESTPLVGIVNQTMANKLWPNQDPIGKRFRCTGADGPLVEVVGIAHDGQYLFISSDPQPYFYLPLAQNFTSTLTMQIRSSLPPESLIASVRQQIRSAAPDLPIIDVRTMQNVVRGLGGLFVFRLAGSLAGAMGLLGLALASVGVYGVISLQMSQRTQEMGIRIALGAARSDILRLALGKGFSLAATGIFIGVACSWILSHAITKLLIGVAGSDPFTYAAAAGLLATAGLLACYFPARRAMLVDPIVTLRQE